MAKRDEQHPVVDLEQLLEVEEGADVLRTATWLHKLRPLEEDSPTVELECVYRLDRYTPAVEQRLATMDQTGYVGDALSELICSVFVSWNLHVAGEPVPLTREHVSRIPIAALAIYAEGMINDAEEAGNPTAPGIGNGSSRSRARAKSRNGRR